MEVFSLLKYWRGSGGGGSGTAVDGGSANACCASTGTTTIVTSVSRQAAETNENDGGDDGPFFDLEFAVPGDDDGEDDDYAKCTEFESEETEGDFESDDGDNERELFKFTLSSGSSSDQTDPNASLSPSDDLFFKGRLVPIQPSSVPESNAKSQLSLLKSASNFRVLMLKLKKSMVNVAEKTESDGSATSKQGSSPEEQKKRGNQTQSKFFTVKFKVEEVPIVSLFTRDNSSKQHSSDESASDEKRFSKEAVQKYLKKVKPLYVRVSKRYGEKLRFSGQLNLGSSGGTKAGESNSSPAKSKVVKNEPKPTVSTEAPPPPAPAVDNNNNNNVKSQKQGSLPAGLRVVCKHLGKSRSASSAVAATDSGSIQAKRRDDSLLQQQDGIQSAILHCKRSFNSSRDAELCPLSR